MLSWSIWLCASLFYGYQYVLRVLPNIMKMGLEKNFDFDTFLFGQYVGIYYIGYTLAHIPLGLALDRYGPKKILSIATLTTVLGLLPMIICHDWQYVIYGRLVLGIGSSCAFLGLVKVVSMTFDQDQFNKMLSFGSIFGLVGGAFAGAPVHYLSNAFGWQTVVCIFMVLGCILSFTLYLLIPKMPKQKLDSPLASFKQIFTNKWFWIVSLGAGFMAGPLEGFADAWMAQSLVLIYDVTREFASHASSALYVGFAFGLVGLSLLSHRMGLDRVIILSGFAMLFAFAFLMSGFLAKWALLGIVFVLGFFCAYQVSALCRATTFFPTSLTGLTTASTNTFINFFGMFFHSIIGGCVQHFGQSCENATFQKGFIIIPVMMIIGILMFSYVYKSTRDTK
ncbi:MAG: hypothetical protein FADNKDHG_01321 [Holosporales bacterium]